MPNPFLRKPPAEPAQSEARGAPLGAGHRAPGWRALRLDGAHGPEGQGRSGDMAQLPAGCRRLLEAARPPALEIFIYEG